MTSSKLLVGVHVSMKAPNYLLGAIETALKYRANSFMIFTSSPQSSARTDLLRLGIEPFKERLIAEHIDIANVVVHGSYLINLANTKDSSKLAWSIKFLQEEIARMEAIGLQTLILHPGSSLGEDRLTCIENIANALNKVLRADSNVRIALETMSGRTNEIGATFEELKLIIDRVELAEKVGVCWDTCHLYSAGYDIKDNLEAVLKDFKTKVGLEKIWTIHLNDSLYGLSARKDRHQYIGEGQIGFVALQKVVQHPELHNVVKILEMPSKEKFDEVEKLTS